MNKYVIRVQLQNEKYVALKDKLITAGFTKIIKSKIGTGYVLPNGNYYAVTEKTLEEVQKIAWDIAISIDKRAQVLTTQEVSSAWNGLSIY